MNKKFWILVKGELNRLNKYNVTTMSIVVAFLWFLTLFFIKDMAVLTTLLPFIIIIDATMLSMVFIGSVMFFEKTESTISTMLVTPIKTSQLILSKVTANTIQSVLSSLLVVLVFYIVKGVEINWFFMITSLIVSVFFFSLLGFVFAFYSKDFTSMLVNIMIYLFLFSIPPVLRDLNVFFKGDIWKYILFLSPSQSAIEVIKLGFNGPFIVTSFIGFLFLILVGLFGYIYFILPKFKAYAVKQSGV
jgi:fluoroquinolone transport system permease protein